MNISPLPCKSVNIFKTNIELSVISLEQNTVQSLDFILEWRPCLTEHVPKSTDECKKKKKSECSEKSMKELAWV